MKKLLALVLALVMVMGLATVSASAKLDDFSDKDKINHEEAVAVMNAIGVLMGSDGKFNPADKLKRSEAAKIIAYLYYNNRTAENQKGTGSKFSDVAAGAWYAGYVEALTSDGVIAGKGNGFDPDGELIAVDFAKMLLVCLGYDAAIEGLTGADYRIHTTTIAVREGLFKGLPDLLPTSVLTRDEAAQMAFNAIKAPLVKYTTKGSTISVNGAEVAFGASTYEYETTTIASEQRIGMEPISNTNNSVYAVEFGERYYPKLKVVSDSDDFGRPASKWVYDNKDVGTYAKADQLIKSWTTGVKGSEIFGLLGETRLKAGDFTYYFDGRNVVADNTATGDINANRVDGLGNPIPITVNAVTTALINRNNNNNLPNTGKGVLTELYEDGDDLVLVSIGTYMSFADADYNKGKETLALNRVGMIATENEVSAEDFAFIKDVKKDTALLYTRAYDDVNDVYNVVDLFDPAQTMVDVKVTGFTSSKLTTGGTDYDFNSSCKNGSMFVPINDAPTENPLYEFEDSVKSLSDYSYYVFLDQYGYVAGVKVYEGTKNYVFLTGLDLTASNIAAGSAEAYLIFSDGSTKTAKINLTDTNANLKADKTVGVIATNEANGDYPFLANYANERNENYNRWFTYSEKNGVYTLKPIQNDRYLTIDSPAAATEISPKGAKLVGDLGPTAGEKAYGNDDSIYITVDADTNGNGNQVISKVTGTYVGSQKVDIAIYDDTNHAADQITTGEAAFVVYDSSNYIIAAVVVGEDGGSTANYAYVLKGVQKEYISGDYHYWVFPALVDGKEVDLTIKEKYDSGDDVANAVATAAALNEKGIINVRYDGDGYVVGLKAIAADKVYDDADFGAQIDEENIWDVTYAIGNDVNIKAIGNTLYMDDDNGLMVVNGAPVYVIQTVKGERKVEKYTTLKEAVNSINTNGAGFHKVVVSAALNANGTAKWIGIKSTVPVNGAGGAGAADPRLSSVKILANGMLETTVVNGPVAAGTLKYTVQVKVSNSEWMDVATNLSLDIILPDGVDNATVSVVPNLIGGHEAGKVYRVILGGKYSNEMILP